MLHHLVFLPSHRFLRSTSFVCGGILVGLSISTTTAATDSPPPGSAVPQPPGQVASSSCEQESLAYAVAYSNYAASLETLNDAYTALQDCEYGGGQYVPSEELKTKLASMPSVLESR